MYVEITPEMATTFGIEFNCIQSQSESTDHLKNNDEEKSKDSRVSKVCWTRNATLQLIKLYEDHLPDFLCTTKRNATVWKVISEKLNAAGYLFTAVQCQDKFKYLKLGYTKKVDNMSNKSSGAAPINFEYFSEMDVIFGKKPNIDPPNIASSSRVIAMCK